MNDAAHRNWRQRSTAVPRLPNRADISRLSRDFVDVDERARKVAKEYGIKWSAGITAAVALFGILLQLLGSGRLFSRADIDDLKKRQENVEYDLKNRVNVEQKLQDFDNRLKDIERITAAQKRKQSALSSKPKVPRKNP